MITRHSKYCFKGNTVLHEENPIQGSDVTLYLNGVIYNYDQKSLLEILTLYKDRMDEVANLLDGHFSLLLKFKDSIVVITDLLASHKVYYRQNENDCIITNNIDYFSDQMLPLSTEGVACYLNNGSMLNQLTLYEEAFSLSPASVVTFTQNCKSERMYWSFNVNDDQYEVTDEQLVGDLNKALKESISNIRNIDDLTISMSAGYDARTILASLRSDFAKTDVQCFSYSAENPTEFSDPFLSKRLADISGYSFREHLDYNGDFISHMKKNVSGTKAMMRYNFEVQSWHAIANAKYRNIVVGDECLGWSGFYNGADSSIDDVLEVINIKTASNIKRLRKYLSKSIYSSLVASIHDLNTSIASQAKHLRTTEAKRDYLYLNQRLVHVLMPFRELMIHHNSQIFHNPLLSKRVLETVQKMNGRQRTNKSIFRTMAKDRYPEFFKVPLAKCNHGFNRWDREIESNKDELIALVENCDSRFEQFMSKKSVVKLIASYAGDKITLKRVCNVARRRIKVIDKCFGFTVGSLKGFDTDSLILIRVLILWMHFRKS